MKVEFLLMDVSDSVHTSQETYYLSDAQPSRLMLLWITVAVYFENNWEITCRVSGQNAGFECIQADDTVTTGL
jgi:hypothetical protein